VQNRTPEPAASQHAGDFVVAQDEHRVRAGVAEDGRFVAQARQQRIGIANECRVTHIERAPGNGF